MYKNFLLSSMIYAGISLYALSANAAIVASGDDCAAEGSTCHWELNSDGKLSITGNGAMKTNFGTTSASITAASYGEYKDQITSIEIDEGITSVGQSAFQGLSKATSVSIPTTLETMGDKAFRDMHKVRDFNIPEGSKLQNISTSAFAYDLYLGTANAQKILDTVAANNAENGATLAIGDGAFYHTGITAINIPEGVTILNNSSFCDNPIRSLSLPETVTTVGSWMFSNQLRELTITDNIDTSTWTDTTFDTTSNITIYCQGDVAKCTQAMSRYLPPTCTSRCLQATIVPVSTREQCSASSYYWSGANCNRRPENALDMVCAAGYYVDKDECEKIKTRFTMQEADALTTNDNYNWVEWTFE